VPLPDWVYQAPLRFVHPQRVPVHPQRSCCTLSDSCCTLSASCSTLRADSAPSLTACPGPPTIFRVNIFRANIRPGDFGSLTAMEFEILLSLAGGDLHGYAIIQDIGARSNGTLTVRPGTLYRAVSRLLDAGLIEEIGGPAADDERRRYYSMTKAGRQVAAVESQRLARQLETARARKLLKTKA